MPMLGSSRGEEGGLPARPFAALRVTKVAKDGEQGMDSGVTQFAIWMLVLC